MCHASSCPKKRRGLCQNFCALCSSNDALLSLCVVGRPSNQIYPSADLGTFGWYGGALNSEPAKSFSITSSWSHCSICIRQYTEWLSGILEAQTFSLDCEFWCRFIPAFQQSTAEGCWDCNQCLSWVVIFNIKAFCVWEQTLKLFEIALWTRGI